MDRPVYGYIYIYIYMYRTDSDDRCRDDTTRELGGVPIRIRPILSCLKS